MRPLLLLTRPDPQARRFAQHAALECPAHDVLIAPMSQIEALPFDASVFHGIDGLVLTSVNAVPLVADLVAPGLPAWCVGPATIKAAHKAGFSPIDGGGDAKTMIARMTKAQPEGAWLHPHGVHLARDLVAALRPEGINLRDIAVYEARAVAWAQGVRDTVMAAPWSIAPLFSPRAADLIVQQLAGEKPAGLRLVAISEACAARLPDAFRAQTRTALTPDSAGMMQAIAAEMSQRGQGSLEAGPGRR